MIADSDGLSRDEIAADYGQTTGSGQFNPNLAVNIESQNEKI